MRREQKKMKVLIIGSGGREHAIAWKDVYKRQDIWQVIQKKIKKRDWYFQMTLKSGIKM